MGLKGNLGLKVKPIYLKVKMEDSTLKTFTFTAGMEKIPTIAISERV